MCKSIVQTVQKSDDSHVLSLGSNGRDHPSLVRNASDWLLVPLKIFNCSKKNKFYSKFHRIYFVLKEYYFILSAKELTENVFQGTPLK